MRTEIDAADVLASYSAMMLKREDNVIQDIKKLPYPKEIIKTVLVHCLKMTAPGGQRDFLQRAYVALADFQTLSDSERTSLQSWKRVSRTDSTNATDDELFNLAKHLSESGRRGLDVHKRASAEAADLVQELKSAGLWD